MYIVTYDKIDNSFITCYLIKTYFIFFMEIRKHTNDAILNFLKFIFHLFNFNATTVHKIPPVHYFNSDN